MRHLQEHSTAWAANMGVMKGALSAAACLLHWIHLHLLLDVYGCSGVLRGQVVMQLAWSKSAAAAHVTPV